MSRSKSKQRDHFGTPITLFERAPVLQDTDRDVDSSLYSSSDETDNVAGSHRKDRRRPSYVKPMVGIGTIVVLIAAWQICSTARLVNSAFFSSPVAIIRAGATYVTSHAFVVDIEASGTSFAIGLMLAIAVGVTFGILIGYYKPVEYVLDYLVTLGWSAPRIALVPLLIIMFGIGQTTEVVIIFMLSVFPIIINTASGVKNVDSNLLEVGRSFGASSKDLLWTVVLPSAVPDMATGIRLSVGLGLIGVVVAEFTAATKGIGYMMENAATSFDVSKVYVGLAIISLAGLLLTQMARYIERRFDRWRVRK